MAKIILEPHETIEEVKEAIAKSLSSTRKHTDPILQQMNDELDKEFKKLHEGLIFEILTQIQKSANPLEKLEKIYKSK